jgi:hypothetical protein
MKDAALQMSWLSRPLTCDGTTVLGPLDPARLNDGDLKDICLRMHVILDTIEMPRCEGRLLPRDLFDRMDTLESLLHHGPRPRLSDWSGLVAEFGEYYGLEGTGAIPVDPAGFHELRSEYADILGNSSRPAAIDPGWLSSTVVALARGIYAERAFDRMPILADALQEAGCDDPDVLGHCRGPGHHFPGCWVLDLVLGTG